MAIAQIHACVAILNEPMALREKNTRMASVFGEGKEGPHAHGNS